MSDARTDLKKLLGEVLHEQAQDWEPLSPEELIAWREGKLSETDRLDLQRRLLLDHDAIEALIGENAPPASAIPEAEKQASWAAFEQKLAEKSNHPEPGKEINPIVPIAAKKRFWRPSFSALVAVAFGIACLALTFQVVGLKEKYQEAIYPNADLEPIEISLGPSQIRGNQGTVLTGESNLLKFAIPDELRVLLTWQIEILDPDGQSISIQLTKTKDKLIWLELHREFLKKEGIYKIRFSRMKNGKATFHFDHSVEK